MFNEVPNWKESSGCGLELEFGWSVEVGENSLCRPPLSIVIPKGSIKEGRRPQVRWSAPVGEVLWVFISGLSLLTLEFGGLKRNTANPVTEQGDDTVGRRTVYCHGMRRW